MYNEFDPKGVFYTDSNGLEMQKRTIKGKTIGNNYYPIDSAIAIRDEEKKL